MAVVRGSLRWSLTVPRNEDTSRSGRTAMAGDGRPNYHSLRWERFWFAYCAHILIDYGSRGKGKACPCQQPLRFFCHATRAKHEKSNPASCGGSRHLAIGLEHASGGDASNFSVNFPVGKINHLQTVNFPGDKETFPSGGGTDGSRSRGLQEGGLPHDQVSRRRRSASLRPSAPQER